MPTSNSLPDLITSQTDLDALCKIVESQQQIALDTEFVRTNTYAPKLGLLQFHAGTEMCCVDPLADLDMQSMWQLLFDSSRTCILHSAKQDMEVMWFEEGAVLGALLDTQICAGLLGYPAQIGYAGLVEDKTGVSLNKSQTRTDWSRRPLSAAQIKYAIEDVEHLPTLAETFSQQLRDQGRYDWALEDSAALLDTSLYQPAPELAWQRVKSIPFLPVAQQARARALAAWREHAAMKTNRPRQWVLADKALLQIAQENPDAEAALGQVKDLPPAVVRKQGRKLLAILDTANQALARGELDLQQLAPERDQDKSTLKKLGTMVKAKAEELNIAAEVVASKRDILALLRGEPEPRVTRGWRKEIIGDELSAALR
jgi:ribonuclease D